MQVSLEQCTKKKLAVEILYIDDEIQKYFESNTTTT